MASLPTGAVTLAIGSLNLGSEKENKIAMFQKGVIIQYKIIIKYIRLYNNQIEYDINT